GLWDGGLLRAKPAGLLRLAYFACLAASLHWAAFSRREIAFGALVSALLSALTLVWHWRGIRDWLRLHWRRVVFGEALFAALFGLFLVVRMSNPDLWHPAMGGEKPMDFAFLNATLKTAYFPPYDPWFAGGYINYYY